MSKFCWHWFHFDGAMCENILKIHLDYLLSNLIPQCDTKTNHFHKKNHSAGDFGNGSIVKYNDKSNTRYFFISFIINAISVAQKRWFCFTFAFTFDLCSLRSAAVCNKNTSGTAQSSVLHLRRLCLTGGIQYAWTLYLYLWAHIELNRRFCRTLCGSTSAFAPVSFIKQLQVTFMFWFVYTIVVAITY